MNPVETFLAEKIAMPPIGDYSRRVGGQAGGALVQGLVAGAGTALIAAGASAAQHIYDAATAKRDFRQMLEWNKDLHGADQRLLNQSFRTLRQFAPDMSKDPLVSGALVRRMVEAPMGAAGIVQEAMGGQRLIPSPTREAFIGAVGKGVQEGTRGISTFPYDQDAEQLERIQRERAGFGERARQATQQSLRSQEQAAESKRRAGPPSMPNIFGRR